MIKKVCNKCGIEKSLEEFVKNKKCKDGHSNICLICHSRIGKENYQKNKEDRLIYKKNYYYAHLEEISKTGKEYYKDNREQIIENNLNWVKNNGESSRKYKTKWRKSNPEKVKELADNYRTLPQVKIIKRLRSRLISALKGKDKSSPTLKLLGCSPDFLKVHLQTTAIKNGYTNFDINNFSGYDFHIDHIIPCALWNLTCSYHQRLCWNWSNLQILDAENNSIKGDSLDFVVPVEENMRKFGDLRVIK